MWRPIGPQIEATSRLATQANETRAPCADTPLLFATFYCLCTQAVRKKDDAQIGLGAPPLSDEETAKVMAALTGGHCESVAGRHPLQLM